MQHNKLIDKFGKNRLISEELTTLQEQLSQLPAAELDDCLLNSLAHEKFPLDQRSQHAVASIRHRLQGELFDARRTSRRHLLQKAMQIAVSIAIPLLLVSTLYLYREKTLVNDAPMVVQTAPGERASITLPDGTRVTLNSDSRLTYRPTDFNTRSRSLEFEGEAFFDVTKNSRLPFEILSDQLRLTVVGTKFNYLSYPRMVYIEVKLVEGEVQLLSSWQKSAPTHLYTNETARYDKNTGAIIVMKAKEQIDVPWMNRKLIFESAPLDEVLQIVERCYDIRIEADVLRLRRESFTGLLPTDNFDEVLQTLKRCFNVQYTRNDKVVKLILKD